MDNNTLIQYTIVGILIASAIVWILVKVFRKGKGSQSGCSCCPHESSCPTASKARTMKRESGIDAEKNCQDNKLR